MSNTDFKERAKTALEGKLPEPCGINCPVVCCDPVMTGTFMPRSLLSNKDNFLSAIDFIQNNVDETLKMKTTDGKTCFRFEGIFLTEIDTDYGFISDETIEQVILNKFSGNLPKEKLNEYVKKIKVKFRESNIALLTLFSCPFYDTKIKGCTIYETRPELCRTYICEQLTPEKIGFSHKILFERLKIKHSQRKIVTRNSKKDLLQAIKLFIS